MVETSLLYNCGGNQAELELYLEYKNRLRELINEGPLTIDKAKSWYDDIVNSDHFIIRLFDKSADNTQVGFVVIAVNDNCPEPFDYYIQDCYLAPGYRNQHIMWDAMSDFIGNHPGRYCLFLILNNLPAKSFWEKLFSSFYYQKWTGIKNSDILAMEDDETKFFGWM